MNKPEIRIQKGNWGGDLEVVILEKTTPLQVSHVTDLIVTTGSMAEVIEPTLHITYEHAQQLMDDLWVCGLRPSEGSGSAGALAATQNHLEDMRKLVFNEKL